MHLSPLFLLYCIKFLTAFEYPNARRDNTIHEDFFGTKVEDPYRWLEDPERIETKEFIDEQNLITRAYLDSNSRRDIIKENLTRLLNYPKYGVPTKYGSKYFYSANTGVQDQSVIYELETLESKPKVFIDPNEWRDSKISLSFITFSPNGKYCAYGLSVGGSDWNTIKIKDTTTGVELTEELEKIKFSSPEWTPDNLGFFYALYDQYEGNGVGTESISLINQKLFYHKLFTQQYDDQLITLFPAYPRWIIGDIVVSSDGNYVHIFPGSGDNTAWFYSKIDGKPIDGPLNFEPIVAEPEANYNYVTGNDNYAYVMTDLNAPNYRLVKVDLNRPHQNWVTILEEREREVLKDAIVVNKDQLIAVYMKDINNVIEIHNLFDGKLESLVKTPVGTISSLSGKPNDTEFFFKITSFIIPSIIYKYTFRTSITFMTIFKESKVPNLDSSQFQVKQVFIRSRDNKVDFPMFIVSKKDVKLDSSNPTLLYGYGGFSVSIEPTFNTLAAYFVNHLNGIYVSANIRGGGEYGEQWHKSGIKTNKQNVFDDFVSAAEYLIENKYTRRDRLTINGASNGGLLVAATSNQRPDLFGCAIPRVGVLDMLRYQLFTIGYNWISDYGNPRDNQTEFDYIYKYSPLHNIPNNVKRYPAMLVMTGDHDDRVVPAHSLKFIAELQYKLGKQLETTPLLIRVEKDAGHGSGKPVSKIIEENTDMIAFVIKSLELDLREIQDQQTEQQEEEHKH